MLKFLREMEVRKTVRSDRIFVDGVFLKVNIKKLRAKVVAYEDISPIIHYVTIKGRFYGMIKEPCYYA